MISSRNKELKVNVMLDPCSTSSYISEDATEELELQGQGKTSYKAESQDCRNRRDRS